MKFSLAVTELFIDRKDILNQFNQSESKTLEDFK